MANHGVFSVGRDLDQAFDRTAHLEEQAADYLAGAAIHAFPIPLDTPWQATWLTATTVGGAPAWFSAAPFTKQWTFAGRPLTALLDDFAQLAGPRLVVAEALPARLPRGKALLVRGQGALVWGDDAEALAMVIEKNARAALGTQAFGRPHSFPAWEARLMRWVYRNSYSKQASKARRIAPSD